MSGGSAAHRKQTPSATRQRRTLQQEFVAALYMGVSTLDAHLPNVYRKFGVRRAGLAARLHEPSDTAVNPVDTATQT